MLCQLHTPALIATLTVLAVIPQAAAQRISDRVRLARGSETGELTAMTALAVTLNKGLPGDRTIAVNEIKVDRFRRRAVGTVASAHVNAANGAYENALEIARQNRRELDPTRFHQAGRRVLQGAGAPRKLALAGQGEISDAGRQLNCFVRSYPHNFHYLAAREAMGDLLMAGGGYENAEKQYAELAKAPWPDYKMRAAVAVGRSLQAQNKHAEAIQQFDAALATISRRRRDAQEPAAVGHVGQSREPRRDAAASTKPSALSKRSSTTPIRSKRSCTRGRTTRSARATKRRARPRMRSLAFLHVDVLYNTVPEAHAEAFSHLAPLWKAIGQDERAREARQLLDDATAAAVGRSAYGGSRRGECRQ